MNVLHLIFSMRVGGTQTMLIDIMNQQSTMIKVGLMIVNDDVEDSLLKGISNSVNVYKLGRKPGSRSVLPIIRLNLYILKNKYDVLHCHNHDLIGLLSPSFHKKTFLTLHDVNIESRFFKKYKKLFAISYAVRDDLKKRTGLESKIIFNGINFDLITQRVKNKNGIFRIVQVSRLESNKKGQRIAIEAMGLLRNQGILNVTLDFIGIGSSYEELKEQVMGSNLETIVSFLGLKDREYIYKHLQSYDLLIQPSFYEGFGLTVVEAMAAKVPVLVSDIDGPIQIIENGEYGFHFKCGDAKELSAGIESVMKMELSQLTDKISGGYIYAKKNFSIYKTTLSYVEEYQQR